MLNKFFLWLTATIVFFQAANVFSSSSECDVVDIKFYHSPKWWKIKYGNVIESNARDRGWSFSIVDNATGVFRIEPSGSSTESYLALDLLSPTSLGMSFDSNESNWIVSGKGNNYLTIMQYIPNYWAGAAFRVQLSEHTTSANCIDSVYKLLHKKDVKQLSTGECGDVYLHTYNDDMVLSNLGYSYLGVDYGRYANNYLLHIVPVGSSFDSSSYIQFWHDWGEFVMPEFDGSNSPLVHGPFLYSGFGNFYIKKDSDSDAVFLMYASPIMRDMAMAVNGSGLVVLLAWDKLLSTKWRIISATTGKDCTGYMGELFSPSISAGNFYSFPFGKKLVISRDYTENKDRRVKLEFSDQHYLPTGYIDSVPNFEIVLPVLQEGGRQVSHLMTSHNSCIVPRENNEFFEEDCVPGKTDVWSYNIVGHTSDIYVMNICSTSKDSSGRYFCLESDRRGKLSLVLHSSVAGGTDPMLILFSSKPIGIPHTITEKGNCIAAEDIYDLSYVNLSMFLCSEDSYRFNKVAYINRPNLFSKYFQIIYYYSRKVSGNIKFVQYCATAAGPKSPILFYNCKYNDDKQLWYLDNSLRIRNSKFGNCLIPGNSDGHYMSLVDCSTKYNYHYYNIKNYDRDANVLFSIVNTASNYNESCIKADSPYYHSSAHIFSTKCASDISQLFSINLGFDASSRSFTFGAYSDYYITADSLSAGSLLSLSNFTHANNYFRINYDSTISLGDFCLSASVTAMDPVTIDVCDGRSGQFWKLVPFLAD